MNRRPPWWPENETWPPQGQPWRRMRGRFFMRVAGGFALMFFFSVFACTIGLYLLAGVLGSVSLPVGGALAVVFLLGFAGLFVAARAARRLASPIGELLEAAGRVAEGDYSARVTESGPREVRALAGAFNSMTARLQAHDEQRRELLADVTHELRTPLTVVQGNLEGLLDGVYPRDDAHLETILEETRVLSRLIDDLRMLALAESGALKLQKEPTDLAALAGDAVAAFRAQADAAGIELGVDAGAELPAIGVDPARMREVLANLIANALRYTPRGGQVRVVCAANDRHVTLSVSDSGAGIAPDDLPRIFDRFYKTRDSHGSGLGLAIAKNLVEAHGGEIHAESQVGRGTTIHVRLGLR
jgi:signal transduction histidine kinase